MKEIWGRSYTGMSHLITYHLMSTDDLFYISDGRKMMKVERFSRVLR